MKELHAIALGLLLCACTHNTSVSDYVPSKVSGTPPVAWTVIVDGGLAAEEYDEVSSAAFAWQAAVSGDCPIALSFSRGAVRARPREILIRMSEAPGKSPTALGATLNGVVELKRTEPLEMTAKHELGHAFGLKHSDGIMRASNPGPITKENVDAFCAKQEVK